MKKLFIGIDGGGTNCRGRLVDEHGKLLSDAEGGSSNITLNQGENAHEEVLRITDVLLEKANLEKQELYLVAGLGMAGYPLIEARENFRNRNFPFDEIYLESDAYTACLGAHDGEDGGLLIIGTGSAAIIVQNGRQTTLGGWGFQIGDPGSGAHLGRSCLRYALNAYEGLYPKSDLTERLMGKFDHDPMRLMHWAQTARAADYGSFVPEILAIAKKNDPVAIEFLDITLAEIRTYLNRMIEMGAKQITIEGGLGKALLPELQLTHHHVLKKAFHDPMQGAILMARKMHKESSST